MISCGFNQSNFDHYVYYRHTSNDSYVYLLLYIDDMLIASVDRSEINKLKKELNGVFEMKDLGPTKKILGIEISRDRRLSLMKLNPNKVWNA